MSVPAAGPSETKLSITVPSGLANFRYGPTAFFTLGFLLFFLPFLNIRCNDVKLAGATGIEIATGFTVEPGRELKGLGKLFDRESRDEKKSGTKSEQTDSANANKMEGTNAGDTARTATREKKELGPNFFMIAAFGTGIAAALLSLIRFRQRWLVIIFAGWAGVASFFLTMVSVLQQTQEFRLDLGMIRLSVNFTFWFFLSGACYIAATLYSHRERNREWDEEKQREITEYVKAWGYDRTAEDKAGGSPSA